MEYLMTVPIENLRPFCCIADSMEDGRLSRIGAANDKDAKMPGEPSNMLCSSPLSFYILCSLEFGSGKRHLSLGCLRSWRWRRIKISALREQCFVWLPQPPKWRHSLTLCPLELSSNLFPLLAEELHLAFVLPFIQFIPLDLDGISNI